MVSGGAALNPQVGLNFAAIGVPIIQGWGLTESSPVPHRQRWNPRKFYMSNYYEEHLGTVGQAVDGVEVALIDVPEKELYVHLHGEGELIARGDNISPGYWKSEEATEACDASANGFARATSGASTTKATSGSPGAASSSSCSTPAKRCIPDEIEEKLERSPLIEDVAVIGRKVRGKTQAWAIVYPNRDDVLGPSR